MYNARGQNIRHISEAEGLPQSFISGLVQDDTGYIWVATRNGLARYDGHSFQIFNQELSQVNSLASNAITFIKKDGTKLWVRYETGEIDIIELQTGHIQHIITSKHLSKNRLSIIMRGWCPGNNSTIWYFGRGGQIHNITYTKDLSSNYSHVFKGDTVRSILKDKKNRFWALTQKGLHLFNDKQKTFKDYQIPYSQHYNDELDFGDDIPQIHERANGELMWTDLKSVFFFNPKSATYKRIALPEQPAYSVRWINKGPDGNDYFIAGQNLYSYTQNSIIKHTTGNLPELHNIQAFLVDNSGLVWTGGNSNGITLIDLSTKFVSQNYTQNFTTDVLLNQLHIPVPAEISNHTRYKGTLPISYYIRSVQQGKNIFIALNRTVLKYNAVTKTVSTLPELPACKGAFCPLKGLCTAPNRGLYAIDAAGKLYCLKDENSNWQTLNLKSYTPLIDAEPNYIYATDNRIWITTEYKGLFYIDVKKSELNKVSQNPAQPALNGNCYYVISSTTTKPDIIYIGSPQGLVELNTVTMQSRVYTTKNGLPDNVIYSILPDDSGNLWMGTNKGLACFNLNTKKCSTYNLSHGLPNNEFNRFHQLPLPNGKMAFGGINGYTVFNPIDFRTDVFNPVTAINSLLVNNVLYSGYNAAKPLYLPQKLVLPHNENTLNIKYAALQFAHPNDINYRYRLKGYDNNWIYANTKREAVYTKLPPGQYTFEVNATNTNGRWSKNSSILYVKILSPWYSTWWAWLVYVAIAITGIALFINFRIRQRLLKNEMVLKNKEAAQLRELDEVKMRFFTNIAHELRTPLTLIMGPADELKQNSENINNKNLSDVISKNAGSLLNLTNQLLDMARLDAGALKPHLTAGDLVMMTRQIKESFTAQATTKQVVIHVKSPETAFFLFDATMYQQILNNLLSNAMRYSPANGTITIALTTHNNVFTLQVTDEGPGINTNDISQIFNRFYSVNPNHNDGYGVGLSFVKELVTLLGGSIEVFSEPEKQPGSRFVVQLPLQPTEALPVSVSKDLQLTVPDESHEKATLLVVEDNIELAAFMYGILSKHYKVLTAENGSKALPMAQELLPDLIISDVLMPEMDGYAFCTAIKNNITTNHIPVLLLTAKADTQSKLSGLNTGANDYITKPFSVEELLIRVNNTLLQQQRIRDNIYKQLSTLPKGSQINPVIVTDPLLQKIYATIDLNLDNDAFGPEELATALSISRTSLHRKAKALTNMAASELLRSYRLQKAAEMLLLNITISEAAYKTGFTSPSYFSRSFKELYGISPSDYIKKEVLKQ